MIQTIRPIRHILAAAAMTIAATWSAAGETPSQDALSTIGQETAVKAPADSSATVMTIDGTDISLADYLYLYNKNRDQQLTPMSRRDYLDLFVLYKLKVAEAREQGLDTTAAFVNELKGYRRQLSLQYIPERRLRQIAKAGGGRITYSAIDQECDSLEAAEPAYRRLLEEYHEGMLLFEISDREVWQRARDDRDGMTAFYETNIDSYKWDEPRIKGYVIWTENDSTAQAVAVTVDTLGDTDDMEALKEIRKRHGRRVKIEHYLVKRGENPAIDALYAGKPASGPEKRWTNGVAMRLRLVAQPEGIADVRGKLTNDYQEYLAKNWETALRRRHTVMVDYNVLDEE